MVSIVSGQQVHNTWLDGQAGFAAFKLYNVYNGDLGWIHLEWNSWSGVAFEPNTVTVLGWAYDTTPGETIDAGQTSSVPEPGTGALLTLAAAGAAFLRRKRQGKEVLSAQDSAPEAAISQ